MQAFSKQLLLRPPNGFSRKAVRPRFTCRSRCARRFRDLPSHNRVANFNRRDAVTLARAVAGSAGGPKPGRTSFSVNRL
jgi:hypothetical protein